MVRRELTGDTVLVFSLEDEPIPVTVLEVDSISRFRDRVSDHGERLDPAWVPEHKPAIAALLPLEQGWVAVFPELPEATGRIADLFDPNGQHHRRIDLRRALSLRRQTLDYRAGRLYGVVRDELDVQSVVGFDLELPT